MRQIWLITRKIARETNFMVAVVVLLLAAVSLNGAAQYLKLHFKKLPVPLARPLDTIPVTMGTWYCVSKDEQINTELAEELGTDNFIFRDYVNTAIVQQEKVKDIEGTLDRVRRKEKLGQLRLEHPEAVVNLAVTYYTGKADTVAHIPDRCYVADGYEVSNYTVETWPIGSTRSGNGDVELRLITFEDQANTALMVKNVCYFFHTNGHYESNPLRVRARLQNLLEKYGYYAKVELMTTVKDPDKSAEVMKDFLGSALPDIEKTWPDWNSLPR